MDVLYLSRRNLLTLLAKLDRDAAQNTSTCSIVKYRNPGPFAQTADEVWVTAVPDELYYPAQERSPGAIHPADELRVEELSRELF